MRRFCEVSAREIVGGGAALTAALAAVLVMALVAVLVAVLSTELASVVVRSGS